MQEATNKSQKMPEDSCYSLVVLPSILVVCPLSIINFYFTVLKKKKWFSTFRQNGNVSQTANMKEYIDNKNTASEVCRYPAINQTMFHNKLVQTKVSRASFQPLRYLTRHDLVLEHQT